MWSVAKLISTVDNTNVTLTLNVISGQCLCATPQNTIYICMVLSLSPAAIPSQPNHVKTIQTHRKWRQCHAKHDSYFHTYVLCQQRFNDKWRLPCVEPHPSASGKCHLYEWGNNIPSPYPSLSYKDTELIPYLISNTR